jgi:hypothetical protein
MNRDEKIKLLEGIEAGIVKLETLKNKCAVILFDRKKENTFRVSGSSKVMTKEEVDIYTQGMETVIYLPEKDIAYD